MIYTCPKCGKKMDLSTEVLINSDYRVVCPQCLCSLQIVGDYAYIPHDALELDTSVEASRTINCPKCGHEASTGSHFCPNCGTSFDAPAAPAGQDSAPEDVVVLPPPIPNSDPLYNDALHFLMNCTSITPMMLRDHFHISDERAAELLRQLEAGGAVGPYNNGGPRQILIPHRRLYDRSYVPYRRLQESQSAPSGQRPPSTVRKSARISCMTWIVMFFVFMFLFKMCS